MNVAPGQRHWHRCPRSNPCPHDLGVKGPRFKSCQPDRSGSGPALLMQVGPHSLPGLRFRRRSAAFTTDLRCRHRERRRGDPWGGVEPDVRARRLSCVTTSPSAQETTATVGYAPGTRPAVTIISLAAFWVVTWAAVLYLDNVYGPFGDHGGRGALTGLGCGVAAGAAVFAVTRGVARRSRAMLIVLLGLICVAGWVLLPRQIDVSESWIPRPNPRWSCTGWSFLHYQPGVQDGSATRYCVGLETRIPNG